MIQKIVGISFNPVKDDTIGVGSEVQIVHDKENQYSSRAIAVMYGEQKLGHIGEKGNEQHEEIFAVLPIKAKVHTISKLSKGEKFAKFREGEITHLEVEFPMGTDLSNGIKSFNENVLIDFRNKNLEHEYWYNGEQLTGGTSYIKKWIKEFDIKTISGYVAKSLGCKQSEVMAMWNGNGEVSSHFGTSVHKALEHYEKFRSLGRVMQDKKDLPYNKALPTHPALRSIVEMFYGQELGEGEILTEVLVTNVNLGLCGYIDRLRILDKEKKICRVGDYKVNIGCEDEDKDKFLGQFAELPPNKLSKYQLQLSFYARLLELSGWTVEGLDAYVYEDKWVHYPMEVLKLDF